MQRDSSNASSDFTHSLCSALLYPDQLVVPAEIDAEIARRQVTHGVYAWWFDPVLPLVPHEGCQRLGDYHMLYVGIAPPSRSGGKTRSLTPIKRRLLRNHLQGSIRRSTLRQSLAAILSDGMGFICWRDGSGKSRMRAEDETRLSEWMTTHAAVSFIHTDDPWGLEEELVRNGPPLPLNLSISRHPFRKTLSRMRSRLGREGDTQQP